jgi:hypothetical protein
MHFFLFDFALAFVALLGYRAVATVTAPDSLIARHDDRPFSRGVGGTMACCGERAPHRLINFW